MKPPSPGPDDVEHPGDVGARIVLAENEAILALEQLDDVDQDAVSRL
jgi:hypothetical protein